MSSINEILELLSDGEWHNLTEISKSLRIPFEELDSVVHFLSKYGFVEVGDDLIKVKMKHDFKELFTEEFEEESEQEVKPRPIMLMTLKGQVDTIESRDSEIVITGANLEVEEMKKESKEPEQKEEEPEVVNLDNLLNTLRFLMDNEWHRYDEITSKLQLSTERLLELVRVLKENDLVIVHDKFGMLRLRQEVKKIQQ